MDDLIGNLKSPHARIWASAAKGLGVMGEEALKAVPYLEELLQDIHSLCRHRARAALDLIEGAVQNGAGTDPKAKDLPISALHH